MSKIPRPDLTAYGLAALTIVCITALLMAGRPIPDYLPLIAMTLLGAGGGMALNTPNGSETLRTTSSSAPAAAARTAAPAAVAPAPRPAPVITAPAAPVANGALR